MSRQQRSEAQELEAFMSRVDTTGECWLWTAGIGQDGYGWFYTNGKAVRAHRWAYVRFVGVIPEGLVMDHLCRTKACVNPSHLEAVTRRENTQRWARTFTHCPYGHEYTEDNMFFSRGGTSGRSCLTCKRTLHRARWTETRPSRARAALGGQS